LGGEGRVGWCRGERRGRSACSWRLALGWERMGSGQ
jgi:hypothetical protein